MIGIFILRLVLIMFFFYCLTLGLSLKGGWDLLIVILVLLYLESQFYLVLGCGYTNYLKKSMLAIY